MSEEDSNAAGPTGKSSKPKKPYAEFPLFPHATKRWAKKILGKMHYFRPWDDPDGSLKKYLEQKDALHSGRKPREGSAGVTVKDLCSRFLSAKQALVDSGELARRSWDDCKAACALRVQHCGKNRLVADLDPDGFAGLRSAMAKKWRPITLGNVIQRTRVAFKYAWDSGLVDRPVRYGQAFKRPSRKVVRVSGRGRGRSCSPPTR